MSRIDLLNRLSSLGKRLDAFSVNRIFQYKSENCPQGNGLLQVNEQLHMMHKGKRCFILGNGPSLKSQDLKKLKGEYTITVNFLYKNPQFFDFNSSYHLFMDPGCFIAEEHPISDLYPINRPGHAKPICFVPASTKNYMDAHNKGVLDVRYLYDIGDFDYQQPIRNNLTKGISSFYTVVQTAILVAVYMGFSEIYLLGCDCTGIVTDIQIMSDQSQDIYGYSYKYNADDIQKRKKAYETRIKMSDTFLGWAKILEGYQRLYDFCNQKGVHLLNATRGGILDTIPRIDYDSLF